MATKVLQNFIYKKLNVILNYILTILRSIVLSGTKLFSLSYRAKLKQVKQFQKEYKRLNNENQVLEAEIRKLKHEDTDHFH